MIKVMYFTAGKVATTQELNEISTLNSQAFELYVRNAVDSHKYGPRNEDCDYVAGSPPADYAAKPVWANPGSLEPTDTVISNGEEVVVPVTGTYATKATFTVANGEITAIALS